MSGPETNTVMALAVRSISKNFSGQQALRAFDLDVRPGEIHALLGHNGSGKSTFIKVLAGVYEPEPEGTVTVRGRRVPHGSPRESYKSGLRFVHQQLAVVDQLSAEDNLALGRGFRTRAGFHINWRQQRAETASTLRMLDENTRWHAGKPLGSAPAITRARLAIGRALIDLGDHGILVLDEPTASLAPHEVEQLFGSLHRIRQRGISVIYVTHRLREVYEIADRLTLLRDGTSLGTHVVRELPMRALVDMMVGEGTRPSTTSPQPSPQASRQVSPQLSPRPSRAAAHGVRSCALRVEGLEAAGLHDVSFELAAGEIAGVSGLEGSGRERIAGALTGAFPARAAQVRTPRGSAGRLDVRTAAGLGIVLARESRAHGALVDDFTVAENLSLPRLGDFAPHGIIRRLAETRLAHSWIRRLGIRPPKPSTVLRQMSGGNRQKVVIARALSSDPAVLVLDEPTAGVDVGASGSLHALFREVAATGRGVLLVSSDLEELVAVADRVMVMRDGKVASVVAHENLTENTLLREIG